MTETNPPRCDQCVHWCRDADEATSTGECDASGHVPEARISIRIYKREEPGMPLFGILEDEDIHATLVTPADWACTDFQQQEPGQ